MPSKLIDSEYINHPDEALAAVDIYGISDDTVQTNEPSESEAGFVKGDVSESDDSVEPSLEQEIPTDDVSSGAGNINTTSAKGLDAKIKKFTKPKAFDRFGKISELVIDVKQVEANLNNVKKPFDSKLTKMLMDPKQQRLLTSGLGMIDDDVSLKTFMDILPTWFVDGVNLGLKNDCALLGLTGAFLKTDFKYNGFLLLNLLALLAKMIECFIVGQINRVLEAINNNPVAGVVAAIVLAKAINPTGSLFEDLGIWERVDKSNKANNDRYGTKVYYGKKYTNPPRNKKNHPDNNNKNREITDREAALIRERARKNGGNTQLNPTTNEGTVPNKVNGGTELRGRHSEGLPRGGYYTPVNSNYDSDVRSDMYGAVSVNPMNNNYLTPVSSDGARGSYLEAIEVLLQWADINLVRDAYPNIVGSLFFYFRLSSGGESTYKGEYERVVRIANLLEPGWDKYDREDDSISSIRHFGRASIDLLTLFSNYEGSEYKTEAMIARSYRYNGVTHLLAVQYPYAAV